MDQLLMIILVSFTSLCAYLVVTKTGGLSADGLTRAVGKMFECLGMSCVFFAANLAAGMMAILVGRSLTQSFLAVYLVDDATLLVLSLLQGLTFCCWWDA